MFYLTVHNLVWLNSTVCGPNVPHDYERLEEAMAAQYRYGDSRNLLGQAAAFAEKMLAGVPFREGNLRTGLLAVSVFLRGNGLALHVTDHAAQAVRDVSSGRATGEDLLAALLPSSSVTAGNEPVPTPVAPSPSTLRRLAEEARRALSAAFAELEREDGAVAGWQTSPYLHRD